MEQIITSILDTDLYKLTVQQAVLELYPNTKVQYRFKNRGKHKFTEKFLNELIYQMNLIPNISLSDEEYIWLKEHVPFFKPSYLEYLKNYHFDSSEVHIGMDKEGNLDIFIDGYWYSSTLWEVPLMAMISEIYFKTVDVDWDLKEQEKRAKNKVYELSMNYCNFAEFGTRRRRSKKTQNIIIQEFKKFNSRDFPNSFVGTSNINFARKYGIKSVGTVSHEFFQATQVLESYNHCNYYAMKNWIKVYGTELGIMLPDTISTNIFLQDFNKKFAILFSGIRHDSSCPFKFTEKIIKHYKKFNIDPMSKIIIFSDSLNVEKAIEIKKYCKGKIKCSFGVGTAFSNDFFKKNSTEISQPLNMVIKLWSCNGQPTIKLSDVKGKENGTPESINFMKWIVKNQLEN